MQAKPRLLQAVRQTMQFRRMSPRTARVYLAWIKRFVRYHGLRHPSELGEREVTGRPGGRGRLGDGGPVGSAPCQPARGTDPGRGGADPHVSGGDPASGGDVTLRQRDATSGVSDAQGQGRGPGTRRNPDPPREGRKGSGDGAGGVGPGFVAAAPGRGPGAA